MKAIALFTFVLASNLASAANSLPSVSDDWNTIRSNKYLTIVAPLASLNTEFGAVDFSVLDLCITADNQLRTKSAAVSICTRESYPSRENGRTRGCAQYSVVNPTGPVVGTEKICTTWGYLPHVGATYCRESSLQTADFAQPMVIKVLRYNAGGGRIGYSGRTVKLFAKSYRIEACE